MEQYYHFPIEYSSLVFIRQFSILSGHGERKAISFETKYAEIYAMDVKTLKSLLEASKTSSKTKIVVVNACHSEEAGKTFIEAGT